MKNVLVIADTHIPFEHRNYLDFVIQTKKKFKCNIIVHIGDLVDNYSISYHEHDPDGKSPKDEMALADKKLKFWFKAFPKVKLCRGNHDRRADRKSKTIGLPSRCLRPFRSIWGLPDTWEDNWEYQIDGVRYVHGLGFSGKMPHLMACMTSRQSTVIGHCHTVAGVEWTASSRDIIFGMSVGCGLNRKTYAFAYERIFKKKPILGCGVVFNNGRDAQFIPMPM